MHEAVCGLKKVPCPAYGLCSWNGTPAELKVHTITCTFIPLLKKLHDQEALCQTLLATVETLQQRIAALEGQKFLDQEASDEESEEEDQRKVPTKKKILTYLKESKNKSKKGSKGSDTEGSPKRSRKGFKEKDPNAPKKNQSSYLFFYNDMREDIKKANPNAKITEIATVLGAQWKAMSASEKKVMFSYLKKINCSNRTTKCWHKETRKDTKRTRRTTCLAEEKAKDPKRVLRRKQKVAHPLVNPVKKTNNCKMYLKVNISIKDIDS